MRRTTGPAAAVVLVVLLVGCGNERQVATPVAAPSATASASAAVSPPPPAASVSPTPTRPPSVSPTPAPTPSTAPPPPPPGPSVSPPAPPPPPPSPSPTRTADGTLRRGDSGPAVLAWQQRLSAAGYWLGSPDGTFGLLTEQATLALQKAAGLARDGVAGPASDRALASGVVPNPRSGGRAVEIDLARQLLLVVDGGRLVAALNTSTGSGGTYTYEGSTRRAVTPKGTFSVYRQIDGLRESPLGLLWRPKYFNGGIAVHGSPSVPGYPASHGCVRLTNPAMDWIWRTGGMPIGTTVLVY